MISWHQPRFGSYRRRILQTVTVFRKFGSWWNIIPSALNSLHQDRSLNTHIPGDFLSSCFWVVVSNTCLLSSLPGEMTQFDEHMFQMGWFNHQLVLVGHIFVVVVLFFWRGGGSIIELKVVCTGILSSKNVKVATRDPQTHVMFHVILQSGPQKPVVHGVMSSYGLK